MTGHHSSIGHGFGHAGATVCIALPLPKLQQNSKKANKALCLLMMQLGAACTFVQHRHVHFIDYQMVVLILEVR